MCEGGNEEGGSGEGEGNVRGREWGLGEEEGGSARDGVTSLREGMWEMEGRGVEMKDK